MNETTAARPSPFSRLMNVLQRLGRSLMLPIAALPAAALLLRFGQPDMLGSNGAAPGGLADVAGFAWMNQVAEVLAAAGAALFENLPLLFAVGVAIGFARKSDGTTALAAVVGYLVFDRVTKVMFFGSAIRETVLIKEAQAQGIIEIINYGMQNPTKVLGGIMMGLVTALLWQRFHRIKLPSWLAFFGGRRFVPIITSFAALVLGVLIGWIWPMLGEWIGQAGEVLTTLGPLGTGIYGLINRLLIPLGLHHFVNSIVWHVVPQCEVGGQVLGGDWNCYFGGAPASGQFMAGFFPDHDVRAAGRRAGHVAGGSRAPAGHRGRHHALRGADLVRHRHHRADRVRVHLRGARCCCRARRAHRPVHGAHHRCSAASSASASPPALIDMLLNATKSNTSNLPADHPAGRDLRGRLLRGVQLPDPEAEHHDPRPRARTRRRLRREHGPTHTPPLTATRLHPRAISQSPPCLCSRSTREPSAATPSP